MPNNNPFANLLANNLRVGAVLYQHCYFTTPPKNKYMVVVSIEPRLLVLLINSAVHQYYIDNDLTQYHVPVLATEHPFLNHDSYASCVEAFSAFDYSDVRTEVIENYNNIFKGWLTDECLEDVYHAVKDNIMIRRGEQKEIVASIELQLKNLLSQSTVVG